jgi:hypothetical protein
MATPTDAAFERAERAAAWLLTLVAVALHGVRALHAGPLWRDEVAALSVAHMSLDDLLRFFQFEAFPLLFPLAVRAYTALVGESDAALRAFGLGVGLLGVAALWLAARLHGRDVPLVSLALVGPSAVFLVFGDSLRGYGLGVALVASTFAWFGRLAVRPSRRSAAGALASALCSVHCLLANSVLLLAIGLSAAAVAGRRGGWRHAALPLAIGALAALSFLPYVPSYWSGTAWNVVFRADFDAAVLAVRFASAVSSPAPAMGALWALTAVAAFGGGAWLAGRRASLAGEERELLAFALLTAVLALLATAGFLWALRYPTPDWYYLALIAVLACSLDTAAGALARRVRAFRVGRLLVAAFSALALAPAALGPVRERMTNLDLIAAAVRARAKERDFVLVAPWPLGIGFRRYYDGVAPWETLPPMEDLRTHRYDLLMEQMRLEDPIAPLRERIESSLRAGGRVFLVGVLEPPPSDAPVPRLAPAPDGPAGWSEGPYRRNWTMRMVDFLRENTLRGGPVPFGDAGPVQRLERVSLQFVSGWRLAGGGSGAGEGAPLGAASASRARARPATAPSQPGP